MDKTWVWHPRASLEYQTGATSFVHASATSLGNPSFMLCPCIDCRNLCHQATDTIIDHLVVRGMDEKYKRKSCWRKHGDNITDKQSEDPSTEFEAYDLVRTAFFNGDSQANSNNEDYKDDVGSEQESEFKKKLEHVGKGSVLLSSFLGPLVREYVLVTFNDWRHLDQSTEDIMWEEIQGRFNLTEEWQKDVVFKQMGALWRSSKSRLLTKLRTTNKKQLVELKPSNIQSMAAWKSWVKDKTTDEFKVESKL